MIQRILYVCVSEESDKPKFRFSPDATPFVPKNFHAAKVATTDKKVSTLSVEAREFYPRNYVCQPEVSITQGSFYDFKCLSVCNPVRW